MYTRLLTAAVVMAAGLHVQPPDTRAQTAWVEQGSEDCAVLAAVLQSDAVGASTAALGVNEQTIGSLDWTRGDFVADAAGLMSVDSALWANYQERNAASSSLEVACFSDFAAVRVAHPDDFGAQHQMTFSQVGFSRDRQYALVHRLYFCGPRCGNGQLLLLGRQGGTWAVRQQVQTVVF